MKNIIVLNTEKVDAIHYLESLDHIELTVITTLKYKELHQNLRANIIYVEDLLDYNELHNCIVKIAKTKSIFNIIATAEPLMISAGLLCSLLDLPGIKLDQVLKFTDKNIMKKTLSQAGIPVANFRKLYNVNNLPTVAEKLQWPIIVKPSVGCASQHTFRIDSEEEFNSMKKQNKFKDLDNIKGSIIVEEFIDIKNEYHCDAIIYNGKVTFSSIGRYFEPSLILKYKTVSGSCLIDQNHPAKTQINNLLKKTVSALDLNQGVVHMEVFETEKGYLVGEIACRPGGGLISGVINRQYQVNIWEAYLNILIGEAPPEVKVIESGGLYGFFGLTCRKGKIKYITPNNEFYKVKGVREILSYFNVGDIVDETWADSTLFFSKMFYFNIEFSGELENFLQEIESIYVIEVEKPRYSLEDSKKITVK
jgi:biotin carboxylase